MVERGHDAPGLGYLGSIGGPEDQEAGHGGPRRGKMLDCLVSGPVFADSDGAASEEEPFCMHRID